MRVVIAMEGSLGDIHPLLAIGQALRQMAVDICLAAPPIYANECRNAGLDMHPLGQSRDFVSSISYAGCTLRAEDSQAIVERLCIDHLSTQVDQLHAITDGVDVLVAPFQLVAAQLVAERRAIPFASCVFSPAFIWGRTLRECKILPRWHTEVAKVRRALGLPRRMLPYTPFPDDLALMLGLFADFLAPEEAVAVPRLKVVGFPYSTTALDILDTELIQFCSEASAVFSFGSHADACNPRFFLEESIAGCREAGMKCVYLSQHIEPSWLPADRSDVLHRPYAPHDVVLPFADFVIHHGGLGTLMAACRHQKPMLIVPFLHDQPYHAERMHQLVGADVIPATLYSRKALAEGLHRLWRRRGTMQRHLAALMAADGSADAAERAASEICKLATPTRQFQSH